MLQWSCFFCLDRGKRGKTRILGSNSKHNQHQTSGRNRTNYSGCSKGASSQMSMFTIQRSMKPEAAFFPPKTKDPHETQTLIYHIQGSKCINSLAQSLNGSISGWLVSEALVSACRVMSWWRCQQGWGRLRDVEVGGVGMGEGCQMCAELLHTINIKAYLHVGKTTFGERIVQVERKSPQILFEVSIFKGLQQTKKGFESKIIKVYIYIYTYVYNIYRMQTSTWIPTSLSYAIDCPLILPTSQSHANSTVAWPSSFFCVDS